MRQNKKVNKKLGILWMILLVILLLSACEGDAASKASEKDAPQATIIPATTVTPAVGGAETALSVSEQFEAYTEELFVNDIVQNTINMHYTLAYPENYGITDYEPTLGSLELENMEQSYEDLRTLKAEIEEFPYEELTKEQQFAYDIMMDFIDTELAAEGLDLYAELLSPMSGYQAQLPVLLAEYKFRTVQDIEDYLVLVSQVDDSFAEIIEFEKMKSEAGLFMPDFVVDGIVDQCNQFISNPEENYMLDVFETEINAFEGLTEEQKQAYIAKNEELVTVEVVAAYRLLVEGLEALKGTGTNDKGLCYYEDGTRYYEYLVRNKTGSGKTVEELLEETEDFLYDCIWDIQKIAMSDQDVVNRLYDYKFCETEPDKILEDLASKIQQDFPELPEVQYTIKYVHPSMQEHMNPAFYLMPPVDDSNNNVIYINESQLDESTLYTTIAHEGYPGHLYQNVYMNSKDLPLIRNLFSFSGYSEGWATYVESFAYGYGGLDENLAQFLQIDSVFSLGIYSYVDMGIHYLGWDAEDTEEFLEDYGLGGMGLGEILFETMVSEPATYLSYFIGYLEFMNLRSVAEEAWGDAYSLKKFHEAVLTLGPAPFDLLEEAIKNYE